MNKIYSSVLISLFLSSMAFQNACAGKKIPQWQQEMNERAQELEELQRQNGSNVDLDINSGVEFPKTTDDLSFSARVQLEKEGLEPYKDMKAYRELNVKTAAEWCNDGDHKNSAECIKYRCYKTAAKDSDECKKWLCANDANYKNSNKDLCNNLNSKNCLDKISDTNAVKAEYDKDNKCKIIECKSGWKPNSTGTKCEKDEEEKKERKFVAAIRKRTPLKRDSREGRTGNSGRGCFAQCDENQNDDLNTKALNLVMHKYYCADKNKNGLLVEFNDNSKVLEMTQAQLNEIKKYITTYVADKNKCDGHWFRNYIMFIGTLGPDGSFSEIEEVYLDD